MFRLFLPIMVLCLDLVRPDDSSSCECWDGYKPELNKNGWQCVGINLLHIMTCNVPMPPKCQCSGTGSSILKDRTGTWCTKYERGVEIVRWPCENTREWEVFFEKNPGLI